MAKLHLTVTGGTLDVDVEGITQPPVAAQAGALVPFYVHPSKDPTWAILLSAHAAHPKVPLLAVVNPASGPGATANAAYAAGIKRLVESGIRVLGYVATGYGKRPAADVRTDVERWRTFYPQVTALFFDEFSGPGMETVYREWVTFARAAGAQLIIGNPGGKPASSFWGVVDAMMISEGNGLPDLERLASWLPAGGRAVAGVIAYGVPALDAAWVRKAAATVGYVYVTSDVPGNPWDTLPTYFAELLAALEPA